MNHIPMEAKVQCTEGYVGKVGESVVDPETDEITHFVLQKGHAWAKTDVTLPLSAISSLGEDAVYLKLAKAAIQQLPAIPLKRHYWYADPELELIAKLYDDPARAQEGLQFVQDLHNRRILKIRNAAVLARDAEGAVTVKDVRDIDAQKGRLVGAITGGLIGPSGPGGVAIGALAGVGAGGLVGIKLDLGFSDQFLDGLNQYLKPGTSALIILAEREYYQQLSEVIAEEEGVFFRQTLTDRLVEQLLAGGEQKESDQNRSTKRKEEQEHKTKGGTGAQNERRNRIWQVTSSCWDSGTGIAPRLCSTTSTSGSRRA